jgi:hypothetical protein
VHVIERSRADLRDSPTCVACGASDARPARPALAADFAARSTDLHDWPDRVALCAACAEWQRAELARDRALKSLAVVALIVGVGVCFATEARVSVALAVTVVTHAVMAAIAWRSSANGALPALVLGGRGELVEVQLLSADERAKPPAGRAARERAPGFKMAFGWLGAIVAGLCVPLAWSMANPTLIVAKSPGQRVYLELDERQYAEVDDAFATGLRIRAGRHRLAFSGSLRYAPLAFTAGPYDVHLSLSPPECETRDADGNPVEVTYRWTEDSPHHYSLVCPPRAR